MTACDRDAGFGTDRLTATQDLADEIRRQHPDRHGEQRQRQDRRTTHRVHIRQCVRGRDAAEVERIIDDRHEKIGGRHQGLVLAELIHGGIVGALQTDQQLRERRRGS